MLQGDERMCGEKLNVAGENFVTLRADDTLRNSHLIT